ncbi:MAG TPA: SpoIID/LytB domain-containing protein [Polyangium sp.]|nr:SpoIID/LytB domain-containing protein [Polyangium sp.]
MNVGGYQLADVAGPERDQQIVGIVLNRGAIDWGWIQIPLENDRGYFVVAPDYLAIGNESDWCRVPVGGPAAQIIADQFNALLPTAFMVDLIWKFGTTKLSPEPFKDLTAMTSTKRFVEHNEIIERQRNGRQGLVVGHKKDLIVSNRLELFPTAVCIYGWHQSNGQPIQPVSTAHRQWWYSDYSHGCRLVNKQMVLDGQTVDVENVLRDPQLAHVLTGGKAYAARTRTSKDSVDDSILRITRYNTALLTKGDIAPPQHHAPAGPARAPGPVVATSDLGLRALSWCQHELASGVREEPLGSNAGPRIAQYFAPARRRSTGQSLGIDKGDWCAVAQSAALASSAAPGESVPHGYRAAVWELEDDAKESQAWVAVADIRSGKYTLLPGDLVVWTRGQAGSRLGHVSRVETPPNQNGEMVTIGGNEDNAWTRRKRNISEAELRGAIKYHDFARVDFGVKKASNTGIVPAIPITPTVQQIRQTKESQWPDKVLTNEGWLQFEEEYLPRVVTGENGRAHLEALKAQAIASRTYCLRAMQDDPKLGRSTPLVNSQKFQVFAKTALLQCVDAVNATRGVVAKYGGRFIIANYVAGAIWKDGKAGSDPTNTEKWVTYNEGRTGSSVQPTRLSSIKRPDNRGCMSQNGADWLARNGRNHIDILRYFYGADVEIAGDANQFVQIKQPREGALMATAQARINTWNAPNRNVVVMRKPSGIEALALSVGASRPSQITVTGCIGSKTPGEKAVNSTAYAGANQRPWEVAIGADQLRVVLMAVKKEVDDCDTFIKQYWSEDDSYGKQWAEYANSFYQFFNKNYFDTPMRDPDAIQKAYQYSEGVKQWMYISNARINQTRQNTTEGKIGGGSNFPLLPAIGIGLLALLGLGAAFVSSNSR